MQGKQTTAYGAATTCTLLNHKYTLSADPDSLEHDIVDIMVWEKKRYQLQQNKQIFFLDLLAGVSYCVLRTVVHRFLS